MIENSCTNPARDYLWHYKHQKTVRIRRQRRFTAQKSPVRCPPNNRPQPSTLRLRDHRHHRVARARRRRRRLRACSFLPPVVIWRERARGPKQIIIMPPQEQERRERGGREGVPPAANQLQFGPILPPARNQRMGLGPCGNMHMARQQSEVRVPPDRRQTAGGVKSFPRLKVARQRPSPSAPHIGSCGGSLCL